MYELIFGLCSVLSCVSVLYHYYTVICTFIILLKSDSVIFSKFVLFQIVLAILNLLPVRINFRICLPSSTKMPSQISTRIVLNLQTSFRRTNISIESLNPEMSLFIYFIKYLYHFIILLLLISAIVWSFSCASLYIFCLIYPYVVNIF